MKMVLHPGSGASTSWLCTACRLMQHASGACTRRHPAVLTQTGECACAPPISPGRAMDTSSVHLVPSCTCVRPTRHRLKTQGVARGLEVPSSCSVAALQAEP